MQDVLTRNTVSMIELTQYNKTSCFVLCSWFSHHKITLNVITSIILFICILNVY